MMLTIMLSALIEVHVIEFQACVFARNLILKALRVNARPVQMLAMDADDVKA